MDTEIFEINGVPNAQVPDIVAELQADPRYISHMVVPEGGGLSTIIVVFRKVTAALDLARKVETTKLKRSKVKRKKPK